MNSAKICISLCAKNGRELYEKIARACELADLIEVRFDCLDRSEVEKVLNDLSDKSKAPIPLLATFRPDSHGGSRAISTEERLAFWTGGINKLFWGGDFEEDFIHISIASNWQNRICSEHQHREEFDILSTYERLAATDASVIKIAVNTADAPDGLSVWKLLERAAIDNKPLIPIAMGEAGKWTRILGPAHGAYMTYAALETGLETAEGQVSATEMRDVFRVKELDRETEVYGLIAGDTSYTASPWMHNAAFIAEMMNRVFVPFQVTDLDDFLAKFIDDTREVELNIKGFSVTNPFKKAIIEHLHFIDATAKKIGAVNTVKIVEDRLYGFNTDAPGFIAPLIKSFGNLKGVKVGIAGAGGAARACTFALKQEGANVTIFARRPRRAAALAEEFGVKAGSVNNSFKPGEIDILVNATPLGTKGPEQDIAIAAAEQMQGLKLVYDLVYNPVETKLIREARRAGVPALGGLDMVLAQARKQFEIWTGEPAPVQAMSQALRRKLFG